MSAPLHGFWTPERVARLRVLWHQGILTEEIGRRLGAPSKSVVTGKAYRLGLPARREVTFRPKALRPAPAVEPQAPSRPLLCPEIGIESISRDVLNRSTFHGGGDRVLVSLPRLRFMEGA